eukprot:COSAG01_NODE_2072_length_8482_cov_27.042049_2_plen_173_part_00
MWGRQSRVLCNCSAFALSTKNAVICSGTWATAMSATAQHIVDLIVSLDICEFHCCHYQILFYSTLDFIIGTELRITGITRARMVHFLAWISVPAVLPRCYHLLVTPASTSTVHLFSLTQWPTWYLDTPPTSQTMTCSLCLCTCRSNPSTAHCRHHQSTISGTQVIVSELWIG